MLLTSCLTASSVPQACSTACSISAIRHSPQNPPMDERLCLTSPPQQTRLEPGLGPGLGAALQLETLDPQCTYPSTQNGRNAPNPEKGNANPNSQIESAKLKSLQIKTNQDKPYLPIIPLAWLALAFDKFTTDIPPLRANTCRAL